MRMSGVSTMDCLQVAVMMIPERCLGIFVRRGYMAAPRRVAGLS